MNRIPISCKILIIFLYAIMIFNTINCNKNKNDDNENQDQCLYEEYEKYRDAIQSVLNSDIPPDDRSFNYVQELALDALRDECIGKNWQTLLLAGIVYYKMNILDEAQYYLQEAITLNNESSELCYYYAGVLKEQLKETIESQDEDFLDDPNPYFIELRGIVENEIERCIDLNPHDQKHWYQLTAFYHMNKMYDDALSVLKVGMRMFPFDYELLFSYADINLELGNYNTAIDFFNFCMDIRMDVPEAYVGIATAYTEVGNILMSDLNYARLRFSHSLIDPDNSETYISEAIDLLEKHDKNEWTNEYWEDYISFNIQIGRVDKAEESLNIAMEKYPDNIEYWVQKAKILSNKGDLERALDIINQSLDNLPNEYSRPFELKAQILHALGRDDEEQSLYEKAIEINPQSLSARDRLATIFRQQQDSTYSNFNQAVCYLYQGDIVNAKYFIDRAEDYPHNADWFFYKGLINYSHGDIESGMEQINTAIQMQPDNGWYIIGKARVLMNNFQLLDANDMLLFYVDSGYHIPALVQDEINYLMNYLNIIIPEE